MIFLAVCCLLAPIVPGATEIELVPEVQVRNGLLQGSRQPLSLISDDGTAVFVNEGKFARYPMTDFAHNGAEDVFYFSVSGKPLSFTTSQSAHIKRDASYTRVDYRTRLLVAAPTMKQFIAAARMQNQLRISIVNIDQRGNHPNNDVTIKTTDQEIAQVLSVGQRSGSLDCYVARSHINKPGRIEELRITGGKKSVNDSWNCPPGTWDSYDPKSGILIANSPDPKLGTSVVIGRRDSNQAIKTSFPGRIGPNGYKHAFVSRGKVLAQTDRLYVRDADKQWKPFGSAFTVLAKSANDQYWLVLDGSGRSWKVTFPAY